MSTPRPAILIRVTLALAMLAVAPGPTSAQTARTDPTEPTGLAAQIDRTALHGEYGLWVSHDEGEINVAWLTDTSSPGLLVARADGREILRAETRPGQAHSARFTRPEAEAVVLRYGRRDAGDDGLHTTVLDIDPAARVPEGILTGVDSLFVVGDVHGEYDTLVRVLEAGDLIDTDGRWTGGSRHVVFLGDVFDRGPDVTRTLWLMYRLEREAREAGGGAHVVLGNHEIMIFTRDTRYVSQKERLLARLHGTTYPGLFDVRTSHLGRWLATRPSVLKVDDALLVHGGLVPEYARRPVSELNRTLRGYMSEELFHRWGDTATAFVTDTALLQQLRELERSALLVDSAAFVEREQIFFGRESPFWFRGYVEGDAPDSTLSRVLELTDVSIQVVGHTPVPEIQARYGGRLLAVDLADPATEMLLLERVRGEGIAPGVPYRAWRYGVDGLIGPVRSDGGGRSPG